MQKKHRAERKLRRENKEKKEKRKEKILIKQSELRNIGRESLEVSSQALDQSNREPLKKPIAGHPSYPRPQKSSCFTPSKGTTLSTMELNSRY